MKKSKTDLDMNIEQIDNAFILRFMNFTEDYWTREQVEKSFKTFESAIKYAQRLYTKATTRKAKEELSLSYGALDVERGIKKAKKRLAKTPSLN